jgi:hypothetical protein
MVPNKIGFKVVFALAVMSAMQSGRAAAPTDPLVDSTALEFGVGAKVQMIRASAQKNWQSRWFESDGKMLSGYWDANLAQWHGNAYQDVNGQHQSITVIGLTPVFRYERTDRKGWYGEAAIGVSWFSELYNNDSNRLSTHFQFADHIGTGYVFANNWELGVKLQHYSNGGYKHPNSGVNWFVVKVGYHF